MITSKEKTNFYFRQNINSPLKNVVYFVWIIFITFSV